MNLFVDGEIEYSTTCREEIMRTIIEDFYGYDCDVSISDRSLNAGGNLYYEERLETVNKGLERAGLPPVTYSIGNCEDESEGIYKKSLSDAALFLGFTYKLTNIPPLIHAILGVVRDYSEFDTQMFELCCKFFARPHRVTKLSHTDVYYTGVTTFFGSQVDPRLIKDDLKYLSVSICKEYCNNLAQMAIWARVGSATPSFRDRQAIKTLVEEGNSLRFANSRIMNYIFTTPITASIDGEQEILWYLPDELLDIERIPFRRDNDN